MAHGTMGSGKTTVDMLTAQMLNKPFVGRTPQEFAMEVTACVDM